MLKLYNKEHEAISALTNLKDYKIEYVLSGEDLLEFSLSICEENIHLLEEEGYVRNKNNEYVIKAIDPSDNYKRFTCNVNIEDIVGKAIDNFDTNNKKLDDTIRLAIAGTGWILVDSGITKRRTVKLTNTNALEVLREVRKVFSVDFRYDAINKKIYVYEKFGEDKGVYFSDELNLKSLSIPSDTYDYVTRLYPYGKDGLTIAEINNGKEYIENFQYSNKIIELIWQDNRYTDVNSLKEDAEAKLEELSKPNRSYQTSVTDLAKQSEEYSYLDFFLGDTVTLLSKSEKFRDKQRIVKYTEYPDNPSENTCELGNTILTFEELQQENEYKNQTVDNITTGNGTINGEAIDGISTEQIYDFEANVGKIVDFTAINADITNLKAENVTITGKLSAIEGEFGTLKANVGVIDKLTVTHSALINDLQANKASITDLTATNIKFNVASGGTLDLQTLISRFVTGENGQFINISSSNSVIANATIKNAMIESLSLDKLLAGTISTTKFNISSDDGGIEIVGATQQFKDKNNKVRIQMGQDTQGNFNFILRGEDGTTTLIDHTGIKEKAIADKLIKSSMVADGAIGEQQINYSSLVTGLNKDTNTQLIKASKVAIDLTGQSLEVSFNSLKSNVDGIQIGGRNLLLQDNLKGHGCSFEKTSDTYQKAPVYKITATSDNIANNFGFALKNTITINEGGTFTLSFSYKFTVFTATTGMNGYVRVYYTDGTSGVYYIIIDNQPTNSDNLNKWFKIVHTFTTKAGKEVSRIGHIYFFKDYARVGDTCLISYPKLESGSKATDYTEAPEDTEEKIESNTTSITVAQGKIEGLISENTIIKGDVTTISDKYTSLKATVDGINTTVASHTSSIGTINNNINSLSGKVTTVENNYTSLSQDLSGFKTTVGNTYSTKSELSNLSGTVSSINSRVSTAESSISQLNNQIALKVESADINNAINSAKGYTDGQISTVNKTITDKVAEIKTTTDNITSRVSKTEQIAVSSLQGKMLYTDPTFKSGNNSVGTYNNAGNGNVVISRVTKSSDCPTTSGYMMKITTSGTASPNHGGFFFANGTRANAIFITKILAQLPTGTEITWHSNSIGTGGKQEWLTSNTGTGNWEEYICKVTCGSSGSFSSTNYFSLKGGTAPVTWYVAMATVFDITDTSNLESRISSAEQKITSDAIVSTVTKSTTYQSDLNGKVSSNSIISSINQTAETIKIDASKINLTGYVTVTNLSTPGATIIDGRNIKTGFIEAIQLIAPHITGKCQMYLEPGSILSSDGSANFKSVYIMPGGEINCEGAIRSKGEVISNSYVQASQFLNPAGYPMIFTKALGYKWMVEAITLAETTSNGQTIDYAEFQTNRNVRYGVNIWWAGTGGTTRTLQDTLSGIDLINSLEYAQETTKKLNIEDTTLSYQNIPNQFCFDIEQEDGSTIRNVAPQLMLPHVTLAIQQQSEIIKRLQERITELEDRLSIV